MAKVYPHWWHDDGTWDFDANTWKTGAQECEVPDELLENYKAAQAQLYKATQAVSEHLALQGYKQGSLF